MQRRSFILVVCIILITVLTACNMPGGEDPNADLAMTITAQALLLESGSGNATPQQGQQPEFTATPEFTPTTAITGTLTVPEVTVSQNTNCRVGPGIPYDIVGALLIGQDGTVVGKNTSTGYWIINNPGKTGTCWLYPEFATVVGDTSNLQEYSIPPTPTPTFTSTPTATPTLATPAPVNNVVMEMTCPNALHSGTLKWEDKSNNEDGFNIYINGSLVSSIPANSTSFVVAAAPGGPFLPGIASIFEVEAFNAAGTATKKSVSKGCP